MAKKSAKVEKPDTVITLGHLLTADQPFGRLMRAELPALVAYRVSKLGRFISQELQAFNEQRNTLVKKYGVTRPTTAEEAKAGMGPEVTSVSPDCIEDFQGELFPLMDEPVTPPLRLKLSWFKDVTITSVDLLALEPFMDDDDTQI